MASEATFLLFMCNSHVEESKVAKELLRKVWALWWYDLTYEQDLLNSQNVTGSFQMPVLY